LVFPAELLFRREDRTVPPRTALPRFPVAAKPRRTPPTRSSELRGDPAHHPCDPFPITELHGSQGRSRWAQLHRQVSSRRSLPRLWRGPLRSLPRSFRRDERVAGLQWLPRQGPAKGGRLRRAAPAERQSRQRRRRRGPTIPHPTSAQGLWVLGRCRQTSHVPRKPRRRQRLKRRRCAACTKPDETRQSCRRTTPGL